METGSHIAIDGKVEVGRGNPVHNVMSFVYRYI